MAHTPIYSDLLAIKTRLDAVSRDPKYSDNKEIGRLYAQVLGDSAKLRALPSQSAEDHDLLNDLLQILSLFFVSFGLTNTALASYASLATTNRLLDHLEESQAYTRHELEPIEQRLAQIEQIVGEDEEDDDRDDEDASHVEEITLLNERLSESKRKFQQSLQKVTKLSDKEETLLSRLIVLRANLVESLLSESENPANAKPTSSSLLKVTSSSQRHLNKLYETLSAVQPDCSKLSQAQPLLEECHDYVNSLQLGQYTMDVHLKQVYEQLSALHANLENLTVTRRWTLRTVDLHTYQKQLTTIDRSRTDGFFVDRQYRGQTIVLYLLRSCYALMYKLLEASEPVSEALRPIYNQLSTVYKTLIDLRKSGGISSPHELYPYQLKLTQVDNEAVDGIFKVNDKIPPGQATLVALLADCFDLVHELKNDYYDKQEDKKSVEEANSQAGANVIGTKAMNYSAYDYNNGVEQDYDESQDNLANVDSYPESLNSDEE